ncbi:MAG: bifunctional (p)ppGpp synthetase/guanosine-3',5'-bis(diphosphate) 3'-pyrophosphohydrolase [Clostridiales bacterium]|nr:bifunctional (p)ppGpp synthetase/guanosine-3',5'-bis(diphosphate) 3'-pyrophosphohydrolase [Clostridiales bacterium]
MDSEIINNEGYKELRTMLAESHTPEEMAVVDKAFTLANEAHKDQRRISGEPYITHPIEVAKVLVRLGMDAQSIAAALLHDTVEDTDVTLDMIKDDFGEDIAFLVDGVTKLGKVPLSTKEEIQAENIRKMLLAMSRDIRVIIIKLADRLHNMRTISAMSPQKTRDISLETIEIYAPIAHRLGIRAIKDELEDLAIRTLDPVAYKDIEDSIKSKGQSSTEFLEKIKSKIDERVSSIVPNAKISGRIKSVHGIYRKMYMQNKNFDEIYDIFAVRVIVDSVTDCYNVLGIIHDMYKPIIGRFKDYISTPKPNMYQSLHTTVIGTEGIPFEVQIRTWEMHHTAEYGVAAHWKYKLGINSNGKFEEKLAWVRQLLESQQESESVEDIVQTIKSDLVPDDVLVYTPKGDIITLPAGSTVIDFAYAIHSAVGNKMQGAKVDGRIVPIDYKVNTGEIVDIITSSNPNKGPSRDWLKIVRTSEARTKIRSWFKKERREENIAEGKLEVEREFRRSYIRLSEEELQQFLTKIAARQHFANVDDFYAAIGYGGITLIKLMPRIKDEYSRQFKTDEPKLVAPDSKKVSRSKEGVIVEGIDNCLIKFSRCCHPLPGDPIVGFITRGHGVSIHTQSCTNVPKPISSAAEPERWIKASWDKSVKSEFKSTLDIYCLDRVGMLADISSILANMHVMIYDISIRNSKDGRNQLSVTITVNGVEHLNSVTAKIGKVNGVLGVERSGI